MYGSSCDWGRFMKNFHNDTICNITHEPQELQRFNCACVFIYKSIVCLFVCLTCRPCGTRLGPGEPDSSKSLSQAKKPI